MSGKEVDVSRVTKGFDDTVDIPHAAALAEFGPVGTTMTAWFASDGTENAPEGVRGGLPGGRAAQFRRGADGALTPVLAFGGVTLCPGETLVAICCGGGGYGPPAERDPDRVRHDVLEGWISAERAERVYRVRPR